MVSILNHLPKGGEILPPLKKSKKNDHGRGIEGELGTIIRNLEMLNQVHHDNRGAFNVTLNLFQGLTNTDTSVFDYGLW